MTLPSVVAALAGLTTPDDDVERADELARRVLARPEFQPPRRTPVERIGDWLSDAFDAVVRAVGSGPGGGLVAYAVVGGAVALLVFAILRGRRGGSAWPGRARSAAPARVDIRWGAERWRAEANRLRAAGDLRGALRAGYQALAAEVSRRGGLPDPPAATARELLARVAETHPGAAGPLRAATEAFEATWYGGDDVDPAALDRFDHDAAEAVAALGRRAPAGAGVGLP